jgi:hypothetical protein
MTILPLGATSAAVNYLLGKAIAATNGATTAIATALELVDDCADDVGLGCHVVSSVASCANHVPTMGSERKLVNKKDAGVYFLLGVTSDGWDDLCQAGIQAWVVVAQPSGCTSV